MAEEYELIVAEKLNPAALFLDGKGIDETLEAIRKKVYSFGQDVETTEGRETVKSAAYAVSRSKTFLDNMGKKTVEAEQAKVKKAQGNRTKIKTYLDDLRIEYRKPLTDWEAGEKKREEAKAKAFQEKIDGRMNQLSGYNAHIQYQEVATMSDDEFDENLETVKKIWESEQARISEEKRIEAERQAKIEAEQKAEAERLEKIRLEQEEVARKVRKEQEEAEAKLREEREKLEAEKRAIQEEKDRQERERLEAIEAEKVKAVAEQAEKERVAREAAEKARQEALRPDLDKALEFLVEARLRIPTQIPDISNKGINMIVSEAIQSAIGVLLSAQYELSDNLRSVD